MSFCRNLIFFCCFASALFSSAPSTRAQESAASPSPNDAAAGPSTFVISIAVYNDFLNAVAAKDEHHLYSEKMGTDGLIIRLGKPGKYHYLLADAFQASAPMRDINWISMARYCNWQEHGRPATKKENWDTTETGVYALNEIVNENSIIPALVEQKQGAINTIGPCVAVNLETNETTPLASNPDSLFISNKLGFSTVVQISADPFGLNNGNNGNGSGSTDDSSQSAGIQKGKGKKSLWASDAAGDPSVMALLAQTALMEQAANPLNVTIPTIKIGHPNNSADATNTNISRSTLLPLGSVNHTFNIGMYDVTAAQWCSFLNAVARKLDPYGLFDSRIQTDAAVKCIQRTTVLNSETNQQEFQYSIIVDPNDASRNIDRSQFPITYVSYYAAVRFCNWLSNGQPTTGEENELTTENGPYTIISDINNNYAVIPNFGKSYDFEIWPQGFYRLPTEDEWYKAAYYDSKTKQYWLYPAEESGDRDTFPLNSMAAADNQPGTVRNANYHLQFLNQMTHQQVDQYTTGSAPYLTQVGAFTYSTGPFGTFDMGGNVNQWTDPQLNSGNGQPLQNVIRGGAWDSLNWLSIDAQQSWSTTTSNTASNDVGFRVVQMVKTHTSIVDRMEAQIDSDWDAARTFLSDPSDYWNNVIMYSMGMGFGYELKKIMQLSSLLVDLFSSLARQGIYWLPDNVQAWLKTMPVSFAAPLEDYFKSTIALQGKYKDIALNNAVLEAREKCFLNIIQNMKSDVMKGVPAQITDNELGKSSSETAEQFIDEMLKQLYPGTTTSEEAARVAAMEIPMGDYTRLGTKFMGKVTDGIAEGASKLYQLPAQNFTTEEMTQQKEQMKNLLSTITRDTIKGAAGEETLALETASLIPDALCVTYLASPIAALAAFYFTYQMYEGSEEANNTRYAVGLDIAGGFFTIETAWSLLRLIPGLEWLPKVPYLL